MGIDVDLRNETEAKNSNHFGKRTNLDRSSVKRQRDGKGGDSLHRACPNAADVQRAVACGGGEAKEAADGGKLSRTRVGGLSDPVYRIMHMLPRSDVLEVVKCRFGPEECQRAASYFDKSFMENPLRHVRLQIGCDRATGLNLFFPKLQHHRGTLRHLDLSRNRLDEDDVATLVQVLDIRRDETNNNSSALEVLDLSYNRHIGDRGGVMLLSALRGNDRIRAVILKGISLSDAGAFGIAALLPQRPKPLLCGEGGGCDYPLSSSASVSQNPTFFLNLNENIIGVKGIGALGKGIPSYVSVTASRQYPSFSSRRSARVIR